MVNRMIEKPALWVIGMKNQVMMKTMKESGLRAG
jgi:hypothetical protein